MPRDKPTFRGSSELLGGQPSSALPQLGAKTDPRRVARREKALILISSSFVSAAGSNDYPIHSDGSYKWLKALKVAAQPRLIKLASREAILTSSLM